MGTSYLELYIWPRYPNIQQVFFALNLTLSTLGKIFSRQQKYFSYFSQKTGFGILCKLSPAETICIKCQILFSGKNKKTIISLSSAESAKRVVKVKLTKEQDCLLLFLPLWLLQQQSPLNVALLFPFQPEEEVKLFNCNGT